MALSATQHEQSAEPGASDEAKDPATRPPLTDDTSVQTHDRPRSRRTRDGATVQPTPDVPRSRTCHLPLRRCKTASAESKRCLSQGSALARAHGPAVETTMRRTWKQWTALVAGELWSALEIAVASLFVGGRRAPAASAAANTPSAASATPASSLHRTVDIATASHTLLVGVTARSPRG